MANISEINGDVNKALDWSRKAYEDYNIKLARRYSAILQNTRAKTEILIQQQ